MSRSGIGSRASRSIGLAFTNGGELHPKNAAMVMSAVRSGTGSSPHSSATVSSCCPKPTSTAPACSGSFHAHSDRDIGNLYFARSPEPVTLIFHIADIVNADDVFPGIMYWLITRYVSFAQDVRLSVVGFILLD
jgi:hypothetical protein